VLTQYSGGVPDQTPATGRRQRVPSLSPDERRAAVVAATIPLLQAHGPTVSTRQIARAAGVAEGTIFGVFADKATLLTATVLSAFDPGPTVAMLRAIPAGASLRDRLTEATRVLAERLSARMNLMVTVHTYPTAFGDHKELMGKLNAGRVQVTEAVIELLEPDRHRLRRGPDSIAQLLMWLVTVAVRTEEFGKDDLNTLAREDIVPLLLDGVLIRPSCHHGEETTGC
jgi:AcrR family transcriptional regulator